ncbi:MAG: ribosome silencing factor [Oscillospiraceae bacterium]|nr:ribosome silencing factor [Oscillospiraceae bacterium]MBQ4165884.1 ribosome silencing factor [Oscillospiraceae bacterium]
MTDREELEIAVKALDSKKARDLKVLKVDDLTVLANYFVIASATSTTQVKALADEVEFKLGEKGVQAKSIEGYQSKTWICLDYIDVIVHVFLENEREFYQLEHLWADGTPVDISEWVTD